MECQRHVTCGSGGEEQASSKRANTLSNKGLEDGAVYLVAGGRGAETTVLLRFAMLTIVEQGLRALFSSKK